jgi:hypothetical protein
MQLASGRSARRSSLPFKPDFPPPSSKQRGRRVALLLSPLVFPARPAGIISHSRKLTELRIAPTPLAAVITIGAYPVSGADEKTVHIRPAFALVVDGSKSPQGGLLDVYAWGPSLCVGPVHQLTSLCWLDELRRLPLGSAFGLACSFACASSKVILPLKGRRMISVVYLSMPSLSCHLRVCNAPSR